MGAVSLIVLPAAVAWACAPSTAQIDFDKTEYKASESVVVFGSGFAANSEMTLRMQDPSGTAQEMVPGTKTTDRGGFEVTFALPSDAAPGNYAFQAQTVASDNGHGGQTHPTTATKTFTVAAPPPPPPPPAPPAANPVAQPPAADPVARPPVDDRAQRVKDRAAARRKKAARTRAARSRALARCRKTHRAKKGRAALKRKVAKRRSACIRRAKRKFS